jgi:hypothetical protein
MTKFSKICLKEKIARGQWLLVVTFDELLTYVIASFAIQLARSLVGPDGWNQQSIRGN